jgi:hypothetical protein
MEDEKKEGDWEGFENFPDQRENLVRSEPASKLYPKAETPTIPSKQLSQSSPSKAKRKYFCKPSKHLTEDIALTNQN